MELKTKITLAIIVIASFTLVSFALLQDDSQNVEQKPDVNVSEDLVKFKQELVDRGYENASVYRTTDSNTTVVTIEPTKHPVENFRSIAVIYATIAVDNEEMGTLVVRSSNLEGILSHHALTAYREGRLQQDALKETVSVREIQEGV